MLLSQCASASPSRMGSSKTFNMLLVSVRFSPHSFMLVHRTRTFIESFVGRRNPENAPLSMRMRSFGQIHHQTSSLSGLEDAFLGYISGKKKATEVAHSVWQHVIRKGDTVVDATCGNGHDTLALLKMVADESGRGCVYGIDIQNCALENTSSLLGESLKPNERELVKLFLLCHSRMEDIIPKGSLVRLVAFNLGYLPGGDKAIITLSERTLQALQSASKLLESGGLISITAYLGHPGGREEYAMVQTFASGLPVENWVCCKFEMVNRPLAPVLIFLFKK